jgi:hypothetical protein
MPLENSPRQRDIIVGGIIAGGGFTRNRGWRIDHLYLTPQLYEKAVNCLIDREPRKQEKPSESYPCYSGNIKPKIAKGST